MVFKYWSFGLFIALIFISPLYSFNVDAIRIEYEGEVISKVVDTSYGGKKEIPHVVLTDLLSNDEKEWLKNFDQNWHDFKWYMGIQSVLAGLAGYAYVQHYIDDDIAHELRNEKFIKLIAAKYQSIPALRWGAVVGISFATLYPFYRCGKLFIGYLEEIYPTTLVADKILVIQKKTFSHSEVHGNLILNYFSYSDPIGYILVSEKEEFFKPIYQGQKAFGITMIIQSAIGFLGGWWAVSQFR